MDTTKDRILSAAVALFAAEGYEAVSMETIAKAVGIRAPSLYKHYKGKRDIFEHILREMERRDAENAAACAVPQGSMEQTPAAYEKTGVDELLDFCRVQFRYWTEDPFASAFRRMLTVEQYRSAEMNALYHQYLGAGPLGYTADLLGSEERALSLYGPMYLLYGVYDAAGDKGAVIGQLDAHLRGWRRDYIKNEENTMDRDIIIRRERQEDHAAVEALVRESFWNVYRPGCLEHFVIHRLRDDPAFVPELDFVMEKDGEIIGQNMFMHAVIRSDDGREIPIMTMGPICIAPAYKRQGFGKKLLDYSLEKAAALGCGALCFEGNILFYGKSGFTYAREFGIRYHDLPEGADDSFFLCRELIPGYLSGVTGEYAPPEGYFAAEREPEAFEEFDRRFPPKQKLKLPGQLV